MIEIIFQKSEDAKQLFDYFNNKKHKANILLLEDKNIVRIESLCENSLEILKTEFYQFITDLKQYDWFRRILRDQYFFDDEDEQQQILEITQSIMEGNREDLVSFIKDIRKDEKLKNAIEEVFHGNISFSFDSFVRFRLRPFMDQLQKYIEISIDEYKMEQDYQLFIQTLRDFLKNRPAKLKSLHLLFDEGISFYDEQFYEMKRPELLRIIDRKLLSNHPVYIDSLTIAPLLSIAPTNIFLYTSDAEQPLVRTIRNIFEERVVIQPISFFYDYKRKQPFIAKEKM